MNVNNHIPADPRIVELWIRGWSLARGVGQPVKEEHYFRVEPGWPQQLRRYVFPELCDTIRILADRIAEPWVFLKVCASPEAVRELLPSRWMLQPPGFMMTCFSCMCSNTRALPGGYTITAAEEQGVSIVRILSAAGDTAAIGRIVFVEDHAVYDRIETHPDHRRRGLATAVMRELEKIAAERGAGKGILVATAEGKALYTALGWQLHSLYTTAVIPRPV